MQEILKDLNKEQKQAATHDKGPLLIVAGAGTGKTTVITRRIAWLINQKKAEPDEILALTFTDKSAGEMEERVDKLMPYGYVDLWISTFHSFAERVLKQHALDIGLSNDFKLLNTTEQWLLVRENLEKFNLDYYKPLGNPTKFIHALLTHFSRAKDELIFPEDYLEYAEEMQLNRDSEDQAEEKNRLLEVANAYHVYQQILLNNNALDFGDLVNYTLQLFKKRPNILEKIRQQFKYIMVDEFQDTNWAQYELIKIIAAPNNNLTVVGDDDQSIYKFRGASISNILQFKKDYPKSEKIVLTSNYRSAQEILDLSYNFIKLNNPNRLEEAENINKELKSQLESRGEIKHIHKENLSQEVEAVGEKIMEIKKKDKEAVWSDFAILVRANSNALPFSSYFKKGGTPYQFLALRGLYNKPIVLDIINYFKLLDNYHESTALYRILTLPFLDISQEDIAKLVYESKRNTWSLYEALKKIDTIKDITDPAREKIKNFLNQINKHAMLAREKNTSEVLMHFLKDSGYLGYLNKQNISPEKESLNREKLNHLQQFYKKITDFENSYSNPTLNEFMSLLNLELESGEEGSLAFDVDAGPDMVKIMTMHAAKGLEFKYVFIPNLVDRRFPTTERRDPIILPDDLIKETLPEGDIHLQEERRLMYVAMTRAKQGLYLTSASDYGGARKKKISRFLMELGFEILEDNNNSGKKEDVARRMELEKKSQSQKEKKFVLPKKFSFTQLAGFSKCPLQYKFSHILKIPVFGKPTFSFGKTMHNTLQKFFEIYIEKSEAKQSNIFGENIKNKNNLPSPDKLLKIFEENWIDEWYRSFNQKEEYRKKGINSLKEFYNQIKNNPPQVMYVEKGFNIKIGKYTLKGRIDRVDRVEGGIEIIDYKTGKSKNKLSLEDKKQLLIYQIAAEEVLGEKPQKLTYHYLDDNKQLSFLGKDKEIDKIKQEVLEQINKISQSDFISSPGKPIPCSYCDYKFICEYKAPGA